MDLKSMLNEPGAGRPQQNSTNATLGKPIFQSAGAFKERPPQPPPLQPPSHHDPRSPSGSSSYSSLQSPYQHTSASTLSSGGQYSARSAHSTHPAHPVASPSPGHGHHAPHPYPLRDGYTSNATSHIHNQQLTSSSATPYTPPAAGMQPPFLHHQRSLSAQSVPTPNSAHSQPPYPYQDIRDSPISPAPPQHSQLNTYPLHPQQQSQPGTPLGPPPAHPRQSPAAPGHPQSPYDTHRPPSRSPYSTPRFSQQPDDIRYSPHHSISSQGPHLSHQPSQQYSSEREKSVSVSPKTVPNQIRSDSMRSSSQGREQSTPIRHEDVKENENRQDFHRPVSHGGPPATSYSPSQDLYRRPHQSPQIVSKPPPPPVMQQTMIPSPSSQKIVTSPSNQITPPIPQEARLKRDIMTQSESAASTQRHRKRRRRDDGIPIFAQRANINSNASPLLPNKRQLSARPNITRGESQDIITSARQSSVPLTIKEEQNGQGTNSQQGIPRLSPGFSVDLSNQGPLGRWEPSITGLIPYEDLTRTISDFLFEQVVNKNELFDLDGNQDATFEIEAKIGHLIDKEMDQRIKLPVETECIVNRNNPSFRVNFESSMTQNQHKKLNDYLNNAVRDSKQPPRIEVFYIHKKEIDRFYDVTDKGIDTLPPIIRQKLHNTKHKPRVRISTDMKTGQELARIIKIRISDLDVHSPRTPFDWRISVNLEAKYTGDLADLIDPLAGRGVRPGNVSDRYKDRMSYRHLAYQIDLTQVRSGEGTQGKPLEHELEVEISPQQVREQGQLARANKPHQYEDLIKGFVDNVRNLARAAGKSPD